MILSILAVILVFGAIVFVHELGHMLAAKSCGVAVPQFSLGWGRSLASVEWKGTRYHISMLPIGGYAQIAGMEGDAADAPGAPNTQPAEAEVDTARHVDELPPVNTYPYSQTWQSKNGWQKAWILVAGPLMNFVLALIIMLGMGFLGFPRNVVALYGIVPNSPADRAGLQDDDIVRDINSRKIESARDFISIVQANQGQPLAITVQRDYETLTFSAVPEVIEGFNNNKPSLGVGMADLQWSTARISLVQPKTIGYDLGLRVGDELTHINGIPVDNGIALYSSLPKLDADLDPVDDQNNKLAAGEGKPVEITVQRYGEELAFTLPGDTSLLAFGVQFQPALEHLPLGQSFIRSLKDAHTMMLSFAFGLRMLLKPEVAKSSFTGPVGIISLIGQSAQSGWYTLLQIVVLLNINIGLLNLLPLPALDGGRLVFVALHGIGIHVPEQREALVHAIGMVMLLGLIGLITFTDILAFF